MHIPEQERIIAEYKNTVDPDVRAFVKDVISGNDE